MIAEWSVIQGKLASLKNLCSNVNILLEESSEVATIDLYILGRHSQKPFHLPKLLQEKTRNGKKDNFNSVQVTILSICMIIDRSQYHLTVNPSSGL